MISFDKWAEDNEEKLLQEYEDLLSEDPEFHFELYKYIAEQYEVAVSDYEDYEYEKYKDEKYNN